MPASDILIIGSRIADLTVAIKIAQRFPEKKAAFGAPTIAVPRHNEIADQPKILYHRCYFHSF